MRTNTNMEKKRRIPVVNGVKEKGENSTQRCISKCAFFSRFKLHSIHTLQIIQIDLSGRGIRDKKSFRFIEIVVSTVTQLPFY